MAFQRDLSDSELAWVPYRLRLAGKEEESSLDPGPHTSPARLDLAQQYFYVNGLKLVEKPGATTTTTTTIPRDRPAIPPDTVTWSERGGGGGGGGGNGGGGMQHTHYIRRLVDLRDELITQEETALAKAVDRLRLHSINNKDVARYRLKLKDPGSESPRVGPPGPQGSSPLPKPMMTTVEKFRQMRPQRRPPTLFPLQGKQLLDSPVSNGSTAGSFPEEPGHKTADTSSPHQHEVEDTVNFNLRRLLYPSSSIPNIGRKALRHRQEALELRTQSLQHVRHKVHRASRPLMAPPFRLQPQYHGQGGEGSGGEEGGSSVRGSDRRVGGRSEEDHSPPPSRTPPDHKMGTMVDGDRLDMEKLNQYYYIYCLPDDALDEDPDKVVTRFPAAPGGRMPPDGPRPRRTHSERPPNAERTRDTRPYSDRTGLAGVSSTAAAESSSSPSYKRTMGMLTGPDRISLPVIHASGEHGSSGRGRAEAFVTEEAYAGSLCPEAATSPERRKRHIVIDMPHIIFNSTTPDVTREPTLAETDRHPEHPGALSNTLTHKELCHKELDTLPLPDP